MSDKFPRWFIEELALDEDKIKAESGALSSNAKVLFKCDKGHPDYLQIVKSHIRLSTGEKLHECPLCGNLKKSSCKTEKHLEKRIYPDWFINDLYYDIDKDKAINRELLSSDKVYFSCSEHGKYLQKVGHHIKISTGERQRGCPECNKNINKTKREAYYKSMRTYPDWFIKDLNNEFDKNKALSGDLKTTDVIEFKCDHGHVYFQRVSDHICLKTQSLRYNCLQCAKTFSKNEDSIRDYIKSLGIEIISSDRVVLDGKELDIYIPSKQIAIEYNGSFWHKTLPSEISKDKNYHFMKYKFCLDRGIHLISIFDVDYSYKKDLILSYLKDILVGSTKIYARSCVLKKLSFSEANSFYEKNHILGKSTIITCSYGLYYKDNLVACMSFQKGRYKEANKDIWCLSRFVTESGVSVVGGASKLLKSFEREYKPDILVSYSDNDYFMGDIYSILGFIDKGFTRSPRYYWYLHGIEYKREQCQLKLLAKRYPELYTESLSFNGNKEDYIMLKLGAYKVYRSGNRKWVKYY